MAHGRPQGRRRSIDGGDSRSIRNGSSTPSSHARQLDHAQSSGRSTRPRRTGLAWMYLIFACSLSTVQMLRS